MFFQKVEKFKAEIWRKSEKPVRKSQEAIRKSGAKKSCYNLQQLHLFFKEPLPLTYSEIISASKSLPPVIVTPTGRVLIWNSANGKAEKPDPGVDNYGRLLTTKFELKTEHILSNVPRKLSCVNLFKDNGNGKIANSDCPIIIVHDLLGSQKEWHSFAADLAICTNQRILTVDVRNHGSSPFNTIHFGLGDILADIKEIYLELGFSQNKCTLIGHGLSGWTVAIFCLIFPCMMRSAVIIESKPNHNIEWFNEIAFLGQLLDGIKVPPIKKSLYSLKLEIAKYLKKYIKNMYLLLYIIKVLIVRDVLNREDLWKERCTALSESLLSYVEFPAFLKLLVFDKPILFISRKTTELNEVEIRRLFPQAVFRYIVSPNKDIHKEEKYKLLTLVASFLRKHSPILNK